MKRPALAYHMVCEKNITRRSLSINTPTEYPFNGWYFYLRCSILDVYIMYLFLVYLKYLSALFNMTIVRAQ